MVHLNVNAIMVAVSALMLFSMLLYVLFANPNFSSGERARVSRARPGSRDPKGTGGNATRAQRKGTSPTVVDPGSQAGKVLRLERLLADSEEKLTVTWPSHDQFRPHARRPSHTRAGPAIFTTALDLTYSTEQIDLFAGTARASGFRGDIVMSVYAKMNETFLTHAKKYDIIQYRVNPHCIGTSNDMLCSLTAPNTNSPTRAEGHKYLPIPMLRFYFYQVWAHQNYDANALILVCDFRDVLFQSNPFTYSYTLNAFSPSHSAANTRGSNSNPHSYSPPAQLVVFQEVYPLKVINRCPFNSGWIKACYGHEGLAKVGSNTVSCSGVNMGTADAITAYSFLMTRQLDTKARYKLNNFTLPADVTTMHSGDLPKDKCVSLGMDQGFHNWILYAGILDKFLNVKVFQQGEGPVNNIGAFGGGKAILQKTLKEWKVYRDGYIYNWNGDKSPVVHQADRFQQESTKYQLGKYEDSFKKHLEIAKKVIKK